MPAALRWLTDLDAAVAVGMAVRVPLSDAIRGGLDRLIVLGLRSGRTAEQSATELADLVTRQQRSAAGFALLTQGTPTNNSATRSAGIEAAVEADAVLASADRAAAQLDLGRVADSTDWSTATDGQRLADLFGIDRATLQSVPGADLTDHRDARAANTALWPATIGGYLETALHPVVSPTVADQTRDFYLEHVTARGPLAAIRVGRQPYGILPTTAFSRMQWPDGPTAAHRRGLHALLTAAAQDWQAATARVARADNTAHDTDSGDPYQRLLDIVALHPTSAEYHQRYARSVDELFNRENLGGAGSAVVAALDALRWPDPVRSLLARLGVPPGPDPDLLGKLFTDAVHRIRGPLVDDRPTSESEPARQYLLDGGNYLQWLHAHAGIDLETIRRETGFSGARPSALLYLLLRHAVLLGWDHAGRRLAATAGIAVSAADPPFVHIRGGTPPPLSESRLRHLYAPAPPITGSADPDLLLHRFIPEVLGARPETRALAEQVAAIGLLRELPTARLERVLVEHLDTAAYRLDAWRTGLATERLTELRAEVSVGLHLGAYGWLEDVRPRTAALDPVPLNGPLAEVFAPPGSAPLLHDPHNQGFLHTPSPAHARTAAVLRAGYLADRTPENPGAFAVNLGPERVRLVLRILDGLRAGHSLGALLGYRFERDLHDRNPTVNLADHLRALRRAFPLRAGRLSRASGPPSEEEIVEAGNVIDGLALVRRASRTGATTYPFGVAGMPAASISVKAALNSAVIRLLEMQDALADVAVAESVHQTLAGNTDRASATLDAYSKQGFPGEPAVVATPRSGITLTHRFGLVLTPGLDPDHGAAPLGSNGPRARAEPAVNAWLSAILPHPRDVAATVTWIDPGTGQPHSRVVTQSDTGLQPIDVITAVGAPGAVGTGVLDDRVIGVVMGQANPPRPDAVLTVDHARVVPGKVTFFELSPLVEAVRTLLTSSRPLRASDLVPGAATSTTGPAAEEEVRVRRGRPAAVRASMAGLRDTTLELAGDLATLVPEPPAVPQPATVAAAIDTVLTRYAGLVDTATRFGFVRSGWHELVTWRGEVFRQVQEAVAIVVDRCTEALAAADALLATYDAFDGTVSFAERFRVLRQAERLLTTSPAATLPSSPQQFRNQVHNRRNTFDGRLAGMRNIATTDRRTLGGLLSQIAALPPVTEIDATGLDLTPVHERITTFVRDIRARTTTLEAELTARLGAADIALDELDAAIVPPDELRAALTALTALLGEDALVVPEFVPSHELREDWNNARAASPDLVRHLVQGAGRDFPVDDWLHGIARVREMPRQWERAIVLSDALRAGAVLGAADEPELTPVQLPHRPDDHWLAMEFAPDTTDALDDERLLFTAHYTPNQLLGDGSSCGLLLDEWTEVIPTRQQTTSIAAHVDRPCAEAPQAMLLVVPPERTGAWRDDDILAAVQETFDMAAARAVEPEHLDDSAYAHLLPATVISATRQPITISTDLATGDQRGSSR